MQNSVVYKPQDMLLQLLQQNGWEIPPPQRQRIAPPPFEQNGAVEYLPEIHMLVPKGWRPDPPGDKCVCDRCIQIVCSCFDRETKPNENCYVHGQDTLVGWLYRSLHELHNEEIAKEIAMDPTKV